MKHRPLIALVCLTLCLKAFGAPTLPKPMFGEDVMSANLYTRLGLENTATADEIKKRYRKLSGHYHADRYPDKSEAGFALINLAMNKLNEAFEHLGDGNKRAFYDRFDSSQKQGAGFEPTASKPGRTWTHASQVQGPGKVGGNPLNDQLIDPLYGYVRNPFMDQVWQHIRSQAEEPAERNERLRTRFPDLAPYIEARRRTPLWPSDIEIADRILQTGDPSMLSDLGVDYLTVPGWEKTPERLYDLIRMGLPRVNMAVSEFIYNPQWVSEAGFRAISLLIEKGYGPAVIRSLGIAGGISRTTADGVRTQDPGWYDHPRGMEIIERIIRRGDPATLAMLDDHLFHLHNMRHNPWMQLLAKNKETVEACEFYRPAIKLNELFNAGLTFVQPNIEAKACPRRIESKVPQVKKRRTRNRG